MRQTVARKLLTTYQVTINVPYHARGGYVRHRHRRAFVRAASVTGAVHRAFESHRWVTGGIVVLAVHADRPVFSPGGSMFRTWRVELLVPAQNIGLTAWVREGR